MPRYCLDTSFLIEAWENWYRQDVLPTLWLSLAQKKDKLVIIKPILDEIVANRSEETPLLRTWLQENKFHFEEISKEVEGIEVGLEKKYSIIAGRRKGINETDAYLIAHAKHNGHYVVTLEQYQRAAPKMRNYKIPRVCEEEKVKMAEIPEMLADLGIHI